MKGEFLLVKAFSVQEVYFDDLDGVGEDGLVDDGLNGSLEAFLELGRLPSPVTSLGGVGLAFLLQLGLVVSETCLFLELGRATSLS
jgi:hypothetical protein